jgi:pteridine reductase
MVTGASRRVGRAIALELAARGCDLLLHARHADSLAQTHAAAVSLGARCTPLTADLDDPTQVERLASDALADARPDILVHNASSYTPSPLASLTAEHALSHFRINALAPLLLSRLLAPALSASALPGGGSIVALTDIHALGRPRRDFAAYAMSKAALGQMIESLARDLAPRVRVNAVAPGVVAFPDDGPEASPDLQAAYLARVPLARAGTPAEAAKAVAFLALDAHYTTGATLRLDGGRWLT